MVGGKACSRVPTTPPVRSGYPRLHVRSLRPLRGDSLTSSPIPTHHPRPVGCRPFPERVIGLSSWLAGHGAPQDPRLSQLLYPNPRLRVVTDYTVL